MPTGSSGDEYSGLLSSSPEYYATFLAQMGASYASVLGGLEAKFGSTPLSYLESAAIEGLQAASLDPVYKKLPRNRPINPELIPVDPTMQGGFRYILTVACADESGQDLTYRTFVVDSVDNLTKGQIQEQGREAFRQALATPKYDLVNLQCSPDMIAVADIQGVFRGT